MYYIYYGQSGPSLLIESTDSIVDVLMCKQEKNPANGLIISTAFYIIVYSAVSKLVGLILKVNHTHS